MDSLRHSSYIIMPAPRRQRCLARKRRRHVLLLLGLPLQGVQQQRGANSRSSWGAKATTPEGTTLHDEKDVLKVPLAAFPWDRPA